MLFDLRGRGRRRTVQTIYLGLAMLMALGLIGFGVGTGFGGGGVAEVFTKKEGSNGASFAAQVQKATKQVKKHPQEAAAWQALTEARLHEASGAEYYNSTTGLYTAKGKQQLRAAAKAWTQYLKLEPKSTPVDLAEHMAIVYSREALDEPANAVQALELVIEAKPDSAAAYSRLAEYAYLAHNIQQGDLASRKAVALVPKAQRPLLELEFEKMKKTAVASTPTSTISPSGEVTAGKGSTGSKGSAGSKGSGEGAAGGKASTGGTGSSGSTTTKSGSSSK